MRAVQLQRAGMPLDGQSRQGRTEMSWYMWNRKAGSPLELHHPTIPQPWSHPGLETPWAPGTQTPVTPWAPCSPQAGITPKLMDVVDVQAESTSCTSSPSQSTGHLQEPQSPIQGTPALTVLYQRSPVHEFQMFQDHLATLRVGGDGISWQIKWAALV